MYSIDFTEPLCQDAIHAACDPVRNSVVDPGDRGASYLDRPAVYRQLELAAKRCGSDCPKLFYWWISSCPSANRLGRGSTRLCRDRVSHFAVHRRSLLQIFWRPRMDWTSASSRFIRCFVAIFFSSYARNFQRKRRNLGRVLLHLRAG